MIMNDSINDSIKVKFNIMIKINKYKAIKILGIIVFMLLLVISFSCKTSEVKKSKTDGEVNYIPYYLKVYEADSLYITKNYQRSYDILDSLFSKYKPIGMENYNEVLTYCRLKMILNKSIKREELSSLISIYGYDKDLFNNDEIFKNYFLKKKRDLIDLSDSNYQVLRDSYIKKINIPLRNEIKEMKISDQLYRGKRYSENMKKQDSIDQINQNRLREIFERVGFPNQSLIGNFMVDKSFVDVIGILLHTKDDQRVNLFMPKVLEYVKKGEAPPNAYAYMKDQLNLYNGEEQYYGSYDNKTDIPINELNRRRRTIGLPNYGYEKWRFKQLYPDEEY